MEPMFFGELVHGILATELDLAIIMEPPPNPILTIVPLITCALYVVLSVDHKASRKTQVSLQDLGEVDWLICPRAANPSIYDRLIDTGRVSVAAPVELHHYVGPQEAVHGREVVGECFSLSRASDCSISSVILTVMSFCLVRGFLLSMGVTLSVVAAVFMVLSFLRLLLLSMPLRQES